MGANASTGGPVEKIPNPQYRTSALLHRYSSVDTPLDPDVGHGLPHTLAASRHHSDKKKKSSAFATVRKKLTRRKKGSKSADHAKAIRELTCNWDARDINALVEEYEAGAALKELSIQADLARPPSSLLQQDLSDLYDYKFCTDVDLIFQDACFPVHRAILAARCPFFRDLLCRAPGYGQEVLVDIKTAGMDIPMFSALLRYLYTGEFDTEGSRLENLDVLVHLGDEFGIPNALEQDFKILLETGDYYDAMLVFSSEAGPPDPNVTEACGSDYYFDDELRCHKAILSARSPFFRNMLQKRVRTGEEMTDRTLQTPTRIVLDETVIPRRYARVLLQAIYLDAVDLSLIVRESPSATSLSEVQAMVAGRGELSQAEEAMELFQIAQFLELSVLAQGCEDIIAESITVDMLIPTLQWSRQPHGSEWAHRQALLYLKEEFSQVASSPVLCELGKDYLGEALQSDYLQASELEVLKAVLKWGEHQLVRRMEEREPNLVSTTAHSVSKKGVKRRDLDDVELREILSEVLPYVRVDHVLPASHDVLSAAIKRGLVSSPPSHMLGGDTGKANAWIPGKSSGMYIKPRLFQPYMDEAKAILEEHLDAEIELVRLRMMRMSHIPDTLYMVDDKTPSRVRHRPSAKPPAFIAGEVPVPDVDKVRAMLGREKELRRIPLAQRAYGICPDRGLVTYQIHLRVVREFGLPDAAVELLQYPGDYYLELLDDIPGAGATAAVALAVPPMSAPARHLDETRFSFTPSPRPLAPRPAPVQHVDPLDVTECTRRGVMPDIAVPATSATPSVGRQLQRSPELGDRSGAPFSRSFSYS
ncbi:BTB/POZ domain-containing protein 7-like [Branchiostoma floridae x Branchiostoma belcheri]|nr:BTB/POZ domain-containing protein 7 [Branchiostoma belcheri]